MLTDWMWGEGKCERVRRLRDGGDKGGATADSKVSGLRNGGVGLASTETGRSQTKELCGRR